MPRFHQIRAFTFDFAAATPIYRFVVPGRPATAGSKVPIRRKDGGVFLMDMSKRGPAWRKAVRAAFRAEYPKAEPIPAGVAVAVAVEFVFPHLKAHMRRGEVRPDAPLLKHGKPDCDKMQRALGDAMTGVVYDDDSQIVAWSVRKTYGYDAGFEGATIVEVYLMDEGVKA